MYSIMHLIESFPDEIRIEEVLSKAQSFRRSALRWAEVAFIGMVNSEPTRQELARQLRLADATTKAAVREIVNEINKRGPEFSRKTAQNRAAATGLTPI